MQSRTILKTACSASPEAVPATAVPHATPYAAVLAAPGFCLGVQSHAGRIVEICFLPAQAEIAPQDGAAALAVQQLAAWLADPDYPFDLPLAAAGSPFQRRVWAAIAAIPRGTTASYGELAAGLASSARAVGGACRANPYPIVVPCHRVVARSAGFNGGLGGFAGHTGGLLLDIKRWLLRHEAPRRLDLRP
ncbi:MAG: methylated-DNA--[protein]-cysteine S-methyltransferase [Rhodocyclaceae bacterium]|nr:methylated-DNA--[protein]-cysteine S-methyltransferase [Rhodocyclaceae bacterium]